MSTLDWVVNDLKAYWGTGDLTTSYYLGLDWANSQSALSETVMAEDRVLVEAANRNEVGTVVNDLLVSGRAIANRPWDEFDEDTAIMLLDFEVGRTTVSDFYQRAGLPFSVDKIEDGTKSTQLLVFVLNDGEVRVGTPPSYGEREVAYRTKHPDFGHPIGPLYTDKIMELIAEFDRVGILLNYSVSVRDFGGEG